jgi:hypothetical protein
MYKFLSGMVLVVCVSLFTLVSVQADQVNESNEYVRFYAHIDDIIFSELSIGDIVVVPADNFSSVTIEFESFEAYELWLGKPVTSCCEYEQVESGISPAWCGTTRIQIDGPFRSMRLIRSEATVITDTRITMRHTFQCESYYEVVTTWCTRCGSSSTHRNEWRGCGAEIPRYITIWL